MDFNDLVINAVVAAIINNDEVKESIEQLIEDENASMESLVAAALEDLKFAEQNDVDSIDERVRDLEIKMDAKDDFEDRLSAIESENEELVTEKEFGSLENEVDHLERRLAQIEKFEPLLNLLEKILPILEMLGLVKEPTPHQSRRMGADDITRTAGEMRPNWMS